MRSEVTTQEEQVLAEIWYSYYKGFDGKKVFRVTNVKIGDMVIEFPGEERPGLYKISDIALERKNKEEWNERTVSRPLPTTWMRTGL